MTNETDNRRNSPRPKGWLHFRIHVEEQLVQSHFNRYQAGLILLAFGCVIGLMLWMMGATD